MLEVKMELLSILISSKDSKKGFQHKLKKDNHLHLAKCSCLSKEFSKIENQQLVLKKIKKLNKIDPEYYFSCKKVHKLF